MAKGPTLYIPPEYIEKKVKVFAYSLRDKVNSFYGRDRIELIDYAGLEDGDVLIAMLDHDSMDGALFVKYNHEKTMIDDVVKAFIDGQVPDITEQYSAVKETIKWEDR